MDAPWRLFLAAPLTAEVKTLIGNEIASLEKEGWPVRWTQPEAAHLTLHFLGETPPERAELLRLALPSVVTAHEAFDLRTAAFGVFPHFRAPRVLWLGLHGPVHRLQSLQNDLGQTLAEFDFPVEPGPYHPHITLGRVRRAEDIRQGGRGLADAIKRRFVNSATGAAVAPPSLAVPVREVLLMRSHLGRDGSRYEEIAAFPLRQTPEQAE
ncbi:MAG: RNA 2',3'-cyclic phosphodiesterase [Thermomicrobiales bacterium]